ncbi:hypothetical protein CEY02_20075 [Bacillus pumilus]|uniref:Uncharacterized protein n=1 Tax=Bacillus pumilus TaxID=1408 RepID=A0A2A5IIM5_BACPU|nr:hypothetical protein [Bacillus pumilus]OCQ42661.1 hypothetical protein A6767_10495 [Aeromonas veronii]PCK17190.1 hypothetical protein CEY02_20075 [Bacillus pumilus]
MSGTVKLSDLTYMGKVEGRHAWSYDDNWYYWTEKSNVVTSDLQGHLVICRLTLNLSRNTQNTIRPFTKNDAKKAIVSTLS